MFIINDYKWDIVWVSHNSDNLRRSDGSITVGVTDWGDKCVYLSKSLKGAFLRRVMAHELVHCFCFSYGIEMDIDEEEFMADWISLYGTELVYLLDDLMGSILKKSYVV